MIGENYKHSDITEKIIGAFFKVYNTLGYGFLEKVYENAMMEELTKNGIKVVAQHPIKVYYEGKEVGCYFADLLVDDKVMIELKAVESIADQHEAQLLNYLKATNIEVGLLLNFGREAKFKKKAFANRYKHQNQS